MRSARRIPSSSSPPSFHFSGPRFPSALCPSFSRSVIARHLASTALGEQRRSDPITGLTGENECYAPRLPGRRVPTIPLAHPLSLPSLHALSPRTPAPAPAQPDDPHRRRFALLPRLRLHRRLPVRPPAHRHSPLPPSPVPPPSPSAPRRRVVRRGRRRKAEARIASKEGIIHSHYSHIAPLADRVALGAPGIGWGEGGKEGGRQTRQVISCAGARSRHCGATKTGCAKRCAAVGTRHVWRGKQSWPQSSSKALFHPSPWLVLTLSFPRGQARNRGVVEGV